jgi:hypothetical protein
MADNESQIQNPREAIMFKKKKGEKKSNKQSKHELKYLCDALFYLYSKWRLDFLLQYMKLATNTVFAGNPH